MDNMKYTVLSFNFGKYETLREPSEVSANAEYVLVTDDPDLKSDIWQIKYLSKEFDKASAFTKSFYVRYHPYEFCNTDIVVVLDGSIQILKPLDKIINDFLNSGKDICLSINHLPNPFNAEYEWFINRRGYSKEQAKRNMTMIRALGFTNDYKGYFEANFKICKNNEITHSLHDFVWNCLVKISPNKYDIDRLDQTILSAVVNFYFDTLTIFLVSRQVIKSSYMHWMKHGTNEIKDKTITPTQLYYKNTLVQPYML